jgi:phospholipase C
VDGLTCSVQNESLTCSNSNLDGSDSPVSSFHDPDYCGVDLDHSFTGIHRQLNFSNPTGTLASSPMDGFVKDSGNRGMAHYDETDIPFYYSLAETFAIDDRYFASVPGPTFPNRTAELTATTFGHITSDEGMPPLPAGYKPITRTIFDLLDASRVTWADYFSDQAYAQVFRPIPTPHIRTLLQFMRDAKRGTLPSVSFVDPGFNPDILINGNMYETDEHPGFDIRAGEYFVSNVVNAVRAGKAWKNTVILIAYDEHGGFYDHVSPPAANQSGQPSPDGIAPGQCADNSNPPASRQPGGGANCNLSASEMANLCSGFTPTGAFPANCPNYDQLGVRVPFIAVSPFSKPQYVSHTVGDHGSILAFIEKRFLTSRKTHAIAHMTARDQNASTLEDLFDFDHSPSLKAVVTQAPAPVKGEHGCP